MVSTARDTTVNPANIVGHFCVNLMAWTTAKTDNTEHNVAAVNITLFSQLEQRTSRVSGGMFVGGGFRAELIFYREVLLSIVGDCLFANVIRNYLRGPLYQVRYWYFKAVLPPPSNNGLR